MDKLLPDYTKQLIDTCDFLDLVSYRNPQHNILNLRAVVGDEKYMALLDKFAGNYTRFPTTKNALEAVDDLLLVNYFHILQDAKAAAKKTGKNDAWNAAEARFITHGQKMGMDYRNAQRRARTITKELVSARTWVNNHEKPRAPRVER